MRVYWIPIFAQGKLHVEMLGRRFPGDHVSGMATFVGKLRSSINIRFRSQQPDIVFVDLGGGFYQGGTMTQEFKAALGEHNLKAFHGEDASIQPGQSENLWPQRLLSWLRHRLKLTLPTEPWNETEEAFEKRLKNAAAWVNDHHDVDGLCKEMPSRLDDLVHVTKGARLKK